MKLKRIFAALSAAALATTMAVSASAAEYDAFLMFTDSAWAWGNWNSQAAAAADETGATKAVGTDAKITGDGTYTVSLETQGAEYTEDDGTTFPFALEAFGSQVWCVDFEGLANAVGGGVDAEGYADCETPADKMAFFLESGVTLSDVSIAVDGETVFTYDDADLTYADVEGNGKLRLEIYNAYGAFTDAYPEEIVGLAGGDLVAYESIAVTFTINGLDEALAGGEEPAPETPDGDTAPEDNGADTGLAGIALAGLAVSGAAVVATKKRK